MFIRILDCISVAHDPKLVVLAALVSLIAGFTVISITAHARTKSGPIRFGWSAMAACVAGGGIWSTHFIAMLGFSPGSAVSYDAVFTAGSALLSILLAWAAMPYLLGRSLAEALFGAGVLAVAAGAMHFTGMKALLFPGTLRWDAELLAVGVALGVLFMGAALSVGRVSTELRYRVLGAALFGASVCSLHFTAMAAVEIQPDPTLAPDVGLSEFLLGLSVALVTTLIVFLSLVTIGLDGRVERVAADADQMRRIIDATQAGLVVCDGDEVVAANRTFGDLVQLRPDEIEGRSLESFVSRAHASDKQDWKWSRRQIEAQLRSASGALIDVAVCSTPIQSPRGLRHLVELRDVRVEKAARERVEHLANHDALTGLPNLRLFRAELERAIEHARERSSILGLLWLDLDHFKRVNDTFGHAVGDEFLCATAARLRRSLGTSHFLARVGGDEFVALLEPGRFTDPAEVARRLLAEVSEPIRLEGHSLNSSLSIGMAVYPHDASSGDALLREADAALYSAKKSGRKQWKRAGRRSCVLSPRPSVLGARKVSAFSDAETIGSDLAPTTRPA